MCCYRIDGGSGNHVEPSFELSPRADPSLDVYPSFQPHTECYRRIMTPQELENLVHLRRARDLIDREYASPLDVPTMAARALMSPAHFSRRFRAAYGETPYNYLMTRRIERAMAMLRDGASVTNACMAVGCTSLGSFSSRFAEVVGESPSAYRRREHDAVRAMPACVAKAHTRPVRQSSRIGEAARGAAA
jgi:AraC-like DNA-binding protein